MRSRRADTAASAVWAYADAIVDLHCAGGNDCELTAWDPHTDKQKWTVGTSGIGFVLNAADPDLPDTRQLGATQVDDDVAGAGLMPTLLGLPGDGKVQIIDTVRGKVLQTAQPAIDQRVAVAGGRVLTVTGVAKDGTCYYGVVATDPPGTAAVWKRDGLNLRTADNGSGCKQDRDPVGGEDVVLGVDPVGREELLAAHDGRVLWHGVPDENVLAVNDGYAVIRSPDQKTLRGAVVRGREDELAAGGRGERVGGAHAVRGDRGDGQTQPGGGTVAGQWCGAGRRPYRCQDFHGRHRRHDRRFRAGHGVPAVQLTVHLT